MNTENPSERTGLRKKAEELVSGHNGNHGNSLSESDELRLIHELEVHQIELELQNEELNLTISIAEATAKKYTALFEFAPMGYLLINDQSVIMEINLSACQMIGKDCSLLKDKLFILFVSDASKPVFSDFLAGLFSGSTRETCDITLLPAGGTPIYVHLSGIRTGNGESCLLTLLDITRRKEAEELLLKLNEKLNRAQRMAQVGSWDEYLPKNELYWSEEMYRIMGFPPAPSITLEAATSVFPPQEMERFLDAVDLTLKHDVPYSMDYTIVRPDGSTRYIHDEGEIMRNEFGQPQWMFGTTQDITERKLAEDMLKNKIDELERFQRLTVGRELTMIELKKEVNELLLQSGREEKYRLTGIRIPDQQ